jgi:CheY-like chemotaxis protein
VYLILLIHWNETDSRRAVHRLRKAGFSPLVLTSVSNGPTDLRRLLEKPIDAIVIDLSRRPSLGRDVAIGLRGRKTTRQIPIVFVDG